MKRTKWNVKANVKGKAWKTIDSSTVARTWTVNTNQKNYKILAKKREIQAKLNHNVFTLKHCEQRADCVFPLCPAYCIIYVIFHESTKWENVFVFFIKEITNCYVPVSLFFIKYFFDSDLFLLLCSYLIFSF